MVRFDGGPTIEEVMAEVHNFWTALDPDLYLITIQGCRYAGEGSDISSPILWTGDATYGTGTMPAVRAPLQVCWLGRDSQGRRYRNFVFGLEFTVPDNYRSPAITGNIAANGLESLISSQALGVFLTIAGLAPTMYTYVDVNYNSYWERKVRP
jgi:hypothetical protein